jgi:Kef-type K+ transport system membrane component KefB
MGTVYLNLSADEKLFKQLNYFSPPFLLMFFVRSGMTFNIPALVNSNSTIGEFSLLFIGIFYFITRIIGKYVGAFLGAVLTKKNKETRTYLGLALVPQAGVAIGLAALGARTLKGEVGNALETIILASSVLYELIGPACAKLSLYLSKSYSNKLEDIVEVNEQTPDGKEKSQLELLIDRIQKIQTELPVHSINEDEEAFTEAAEQQNIGFWGEIQKQNLKETVRKRRKK